MENERFWNEIGLQHSLMFDRQDREVAALKALTLNEFKDHFEELLFNENKTRRLDYQLTSVKHADR
jgi:secreted Zn-dependent insulinase-like peptidase